MHQRLHESRCDWRMISDIQDVADSECNIFSGTTVVFACMKWG